MPPVISIEHLSKSYRLGQIGTGAFSRDLEVWRAKLRGAWRPIRLLRQPFVCARGALSTRLRIGEPRSRLTDTI